MLQKTYWLKKVTDFLNKSSRNKTSRRTWDLRYQKLHLYQLGATTTAALIRNLLRSSFVRIFQFQSSLAAAAAF